MDPVTIATAAELATLAIKTIQQYSSGEITQEQAHEQLVLGAQSLISAIDMFNNADPNPPKAA